MSIIYTSDGGLIPAVPTVVSYHATHRSAVVKVLFPGGLRIDGIWISQKNGVRRVQTPSRGYQRKDGTTVYDPVVEFSTPEGHAEFERQVLAALDRFIGVAGSQNGQYNAAS